jgi:uncharacterized protein (UPF0276 family)
MVNLLSAPDNSKVEALPPPETVGVGFPYISLLPSELYRSGVLDFVEIVPETLCRGLPDMSMALAPELVDRAMTICGALPIVVHGVELSIGSVHGWNGAYLDMLDRFQKSWPFIWHSEHLVFQTIPSDEGKSLNIGVPLPLPATDEVVRLVADRSAAILRRYGVPFLLENPAHYLVDLSCEPEVGDEIELMNRITELGHCGHLLDLHNLHCNEVNLKFDAFEAIDRTKLERVVEIHVAGGSWSEGFRMDSHEGRVPERVWELLEYTLPRSHNVAGVLFELLDENALRLGVEAITDELARAREIWLRCRRAAESHRE